MRSRWIVWMVVVGIARTALAQVPGQLEPPSPAFLEKRVPEELAAEGVLLSRHNLALQLEQVGDRWLVSLADLATGRVVASTKVDTVPVDREAAVASMTHVVADLVVQVIGRGEPPPPPPAPVGAPAEPPRPADVDDRAEREIAELKFKRRSIRFGANFQLFSTGQTVGLIRRWVVYRGDLDQELEPEAFYTEVGRADLAESYRSRRHVMIGSFVASAVALGAGVLVLGGASGDNCQAASPDFDTCFENHRRDFHDALIESSVILGVGLVAWGVGFYLYAHPHPVDENVAKSLADDYNQSLRRGLGLPTATRQRPWLRDVGWTPYVTGHQAGLAFGARF